jgi:DNA polymerase III delta prime subunit
VISTNFITKDAQNSLLKIFEEPRADSVFFLIMPEGTELLPTLKSRMIIIKGLAGKNSLFQVEDFLNAKIGKRFDMISKILKDIKDEKKTKADIIVFVKELEKSVKGLTAIEDIEKALSYLNDEAPSIKVILEHLALVL